MKFLIDECLPHLLVRDLADRGYPDAIHPIHVGMLGSRDDTILDRALAEDRVIVTANARDFHRLLTRQSVHPGAIIIDHMDRTHALQLLALAIAFIELQPSSDNYMVNRVVEVSAAGGVTTYELPPATEV